MNIDDFQRINAMRARRWHQGDLNQWSLLEWCGAMAGEVGEACNAAKKLRRLEKELPNREAGVPSSDRRHLETWVTREVVDGIIYGLIILSVLGVDAGAAIAVVFDQKSVEYGFPERAPDGTG